jgi:hypothetical protein
MKLMNLMEIMTTALMILTIWRMSGTSIVMMMKSEELQTMPNNNTKASYMPETKPDSSTPGRKYSNPRSQPATSHPWDRWLVDGICSRLNTMEVRCHARS